MEITETSKGQTYKAATVVGADNDEQALDFVLDHFRETRNRCHGWHMVADVANNSTVVMLYTEN